MCFFLLKIHNEVRLLALPGKNSVLRNPSWGESGGSITTSGRKRWCEHELGFPAKLPSDLPCQIAWLFGCSMLFLSVFQFNQHTFSQLHLKQMGLGIDYIKVIKVWFCSKFRHHTSAPPSKNQHVARWYFGLQRSNHATQAALESARKARTTGPGGRF